MAESKTVVNPLVPLNGSNYPTWKLQCRMALVRDGLWGIVSGDEKEPEAAGDKRTKFIAHRDRALATIRGVGRGVLEVLEHPQYF